MQKHILIIGGGIAGLAAGCYARMNGYKATIFEMHHLPGGLCTAWERKGYTFDGCIHYLFGSGKGQPFNDLWLELGAIQNRPMINHNEYQRITDGENTLIVYCDPDQLQDHLCQISPQDAPLIKQFCAGVRQFTHFDLSALYRKPRQLMNTVDWREFGMKMMPYLLPMAKWATLSAGEFASRFQHPFLKRAFAQMFSWEEAPVMMGMALLAYMHNHNAGFPCGGSLAFAQAIESRFLELGGEIFYKAQTETMPMLINGVSKTLPRLHHFYMAGQSVEPGGSVPLAAASGKNVIQLICAADGKPFITQYGIALSSFLAQLA